MSEEGNGRVGFSACGGRRGDRKSSETAGLQLHQPLQPVSQSLAERAVRSIEPVLGFSSGFSVALFAPASFVSSFVHSDRKKNRVFWEKLRLPTLPRDKHQCQVKEFFKKNFAWYLYNHERIGDRIVFKNS